MQGDFLNSEAEATCHAAAEGVRIERGVPLPGRPAPYSSGRTKYPFAQMGVGDSFETEAPAVAAAARKFRDRMAALGEVVLLIVRKQSSGLYRCWRLDPSNPQAGGDLHPRGRKPKATKVTKATKATARGQNRRSVPRR